MATVSPEELRKRISNIFGGDCVITWSPFIFLEEV
jgi:hypothetical protein